MAIAVVGVSHHTAPIEVRERFAFSREGARAALVRMVESGVAREAVLLSTCNRTEWYVAAEEGGAGEAVVAAAAALAAQAGFGGDEASEYLYDLYGRAAVEHLFRVASSLDSMVLGEAQIQGQVREAYEDAVAAGGGQRVVGPILSRLFEAALSVGGRVRNETELGLGAASIPSAAVELAKKIFGTLRGRRALVVGAGDMSALALDCLHAEGLTEVAVASRTLARARALAERVGGRAIRFEEFPGVLPETDILIAATAAPHIVVGREAVERALPGGPRRPLLILDIALPRDVEEAVGAIGNVFLYDIDDLRQIVDGNLERRRREVAAAERIVEAGVVEYWRWYASRDVAPVIRELRGRAETVRRVEVERALRKLGHLSDADRAAVEALTRQLLNKVLHPPTVRLREAASDGRAEEVVDAARYLFELGGDGSDGSGAGAPVDGAPASDGR